MKEQPHELLGRLFGAYVSKLTISCLTYNTSVCGGHSVQSLKLQITLEAPLRMCRNRAGSLVMFSATEDTNFVTGRVYTLASVDMLQGPETDALLDSFKSKEIL